MHADITQENNLTHTKEPKQSQRVNPVRWSQISTTTECIKQTNTCTADHTASVHAQKGDSLFTPVWNLLPPSSTATV